MKLDKVIGDCLCLKELHGGRKFDVKMNLDRLLGKFRVDYTSRHVISVYNL